MGLHDSASVAFCGAITYGNLYNRHMEQLANIIMLLILGVITIVLLGLIAGFSPTLYIAQAASIAKPKSAVRFTLALMSGVLVATITLMILFQIFSLNSLINIIHSTVQALLVSVVFNVLIGAAFIFGGLRYIHTKDTKKAYEADTKAVKKYGGFSALLGFGFVKTFLSISGVTAIFIAGNIISSATNIFLERIIFTLVFLAASIAPFLLILYFLQKHPNKLQSWVNSVKIHLGKINYRTTVGVGAIILGGAIVIFNVMIALFY